MPSRSVPIDRPLELRRVLAPLTGPWGSFGPDGWWRAMRTSGGPATVLIRRAGAVVDADAWGPGAGWVLEQVPGLIGLLDPREGFETDHPLVGEIARRHPGWRIGHTGLVYEALVPAVVGQKVTGKEAGRGMRGLLRSFSEPAPGPRPGLHLPPDPDRVVAAPYHAFHPLGIERRRADTLRRAAAEADRIDRLAGVAAVEAQAWLRRIPGVGAWSAAETVAVSHGDPDAVSVGDFHLKHQVCWHLAGEARGSDERMLELLEPFRPHRGRVVRFLESLAPYPRYGPRSPVRSFEHL
jgi:3-methyladenine DNA glycosylase/8-oxoguanine DNA glycosylase